jgi:hypothetical protein
MYGAFYQKFGTITQPILESRLRLNDENLWMPIHLSSPPNALGRFQKHLHEIAWLYIL